ncbi:MAG: hypothetical protein ACPIOQ_84900, partial [Promethearchaeia archaeon]
CDEVELLSLALCCLCIFSGMGISVSATAGLSALQGGKSLGGEGCGSETSSGVARAQGDGEGLEGAGGG